MATLASRLARLEQQGDGDGAKVRGVVHDYDCEGENPEAVTVQPGGLRVSVAAFHARWPRGLLVIRQTYGVGKGAA
jgi:hypothetical protein